MTPPHCWFWLPPWAKVNSSTNVNSARDDVISLLFMRTFSQSTTLISTPTRVSCRAPSIIRTYGRVSYQAPRATSRVSPGPDILVGMMAVNYIKTHELASTCTITAADLTCAKSSQWWVWPLCNKCIFPFHLEWYAHVLITSSLWHVQEHMYRYMYTCSVWEGLAIIVSGVEKRAHFAY